MQKHMKVMTEVFDSLSIVSDPMEEDRVIHLLASLPESFKVLLRKCLHWSQ